MMNIDKCAVQLLDNYLAGMKIKPVVRYHYPLLEQQNEGSVTACQIGIKKQQKYKYLSIRNQRLHIMPRNIKHVHIQCI